MKIILTLCFVSVLAGAGLYFSSTNSALQSSDTDMMQLGNFAYQEKRYEDAFNWYSNAANQGIAPAQYKLSQLYAKGEGVDIDTEIATSWLHKAAKLGFAKAEYEYGEALEFGRGIEKSDISQVSPWYKKSAQHGYPEAMLKLAQLYFSGNGLEQDTKQALHWAQLAQQHKVAQAQSFIQTLFQSVTDQAKSNDTKAQYMLSQMYNDGSGGEQNNKKSLLWLKKAALQGYIEAQYDLGKIYAKNKSFDDAVYWLTKASEQGNTQAGYTSIALFAKSSSNSVDTSHAWRWLYHGKQMKDPKTLYNLATVLHEGKMGLPASNFNYETWLNQAAQGGIIEAQNNLARQIILHRGSAKKAMFWLKRAAQSDQKAQFNLGLVYARGEGITPDDDAAVIWWRKAAEKGDVQAKLMLGMFYNLGRGVGRSETDAESWYLKAAESGDTTAIYNLAVLNYNGLGIERNFDKAAKYFSQLSEQNDTDAQNIYASLFLEGQGVKYSPETAVKWFEKATAAGNVKAMFNLATQYRTGNGIKQNDKKSLFWYEKAADLNFAPAQNAVGYMYAQGRGVKMDKDMAEIWFQKASDNGLRLAQKNADALKQRGSFALLRLQIDNQIRNDVLTNKKLDLAPWLEAHQEVIL